MSSLILGLDIGTTTVSVVAIDESGAQRASITVPHHAGIDGLLPGYAEQSPNLLWQATSTALQQVTAANPGVSIHAAGLTGQMHSTLLLDNAGTPCGNIITWQDARSAVHLRNGVSVYEALLSRLSPQMMGPTGCRLAPGYLGTTLFALRQLGELPANACRVTFVADWIASRLCGQLPVTDRSHAASAGLYDLIDDRWSPDLLAATETPASWLPEVGDSGVVIGRVSPEVTSFTGLPHGTRICNAIGDNQASVLSSLPTNDQALLINIGTGGQIVWRVPSFRRAAGMDTRYLPTSAAEAEPTFMLVGAGLCGGDAFAWINRTIRGWLHAFDVQKTEDEIWQHLSEQIDLLPDDASALTCEPFFAGTRPDPARRGVFRGVGASNFTPAGVARSILQGIAESMYGVYASAEGNRPDPLTAIAMSGNGARRNPFLVSAVAERFGVPTSVAACREEAATGAAILAGVRTGQWPDIQTAQQRIHCAVVERRREA